MSSEGPAHEKVFRAEVHVRNHGSAGGSGRSKKEAETAAAAVMLGRLESEGKETL